jgi:hypothetical protein
MPKETMSPVNGGMAVWAAATRSCTLDIGSRPSNESHLKYLGCYWDTARTAAQRRSISVSARLLVAAEGQRGHLGIRYRDGTMERAYTEKH